MKKLTTLILLVIIVFACSRKTVVTTEAKTENKIVEKPDTALETAIVEDKLISNTPVKTDPAHNDAVVAGQRIYIANCGRCHALNPVEKFTAQRWEGILKNEIPKAKLNAEQSKKVTAYIMANAKK